MSKRWRPGEVNVWRCEHRLVNYAVTSKSADKPRHCKGSAELLEADRLIAICKFRICKM